ncbi:hypothetical protein [Streptomyces chartreusis]|uniref:hypothetical protein n=1 Tax=Streptomyces chartreusis TaxID=1969 RepID=UPI003789AB54
MVVDTDISDLLRDAGSDRLAVFVASCTERMAQLFTGLRGTDPDRTGDVDLYLQILEELWRIDLPGSAFSARAASLQEFAELQPSEEGIVAVDDIYAFYAVLCMRYAVLCRANGDAEDAVRCAHASLTALGQLDQNLPQSRLFEGEREHQRRVMFTDIGADRALPQLRELDRAASRERLLAVKSRLEK